MYSRMPFINTDAVLAVNVASIVIQSRNCASVSLVLETSPIVELAREFQRRSQVELLVVSPSFGGILHCSNRWSLISKLSLHASPVIDSPLT